jgi:hypothetical protein
VENEWLGIVEESVPFERKGDVKSTAFGREMALRLQVIRDE